ncbi:hypothetical protein ABB05_13870 [Lederbergia galactosidilytica]|uniref:Uncharacterized protein n=1 Tax=Lederbergia galactosidilytica TaxID=217031 RepID=A0A0Q9XS87_9BACI|nr:hypothetical protein ACA29_19490 [Lederbergia galactosidilytica]OAK69058.1 hypothetical protein ABB05_13870 [Lederbergia galactosidilytica]
MLSPYLFAIASIIAVLSMVITFKIHLDKLKVNPEKRAEIQTKFFIGVAISEVIPLILVVSGFATMQPIQDMSVLFVPFLFILFSILIGPSFIFLQTKVDVTEDMKSIVMSFAMIALSLTMSIPIVSLVGLFIQMP